MSKNIYRRALSGGGTLLKRERTAVKKHTESFEVSRNPKCVLFQFTSCLHFDSNFFQSHLNSATTKHRIQDNHQVRSAPQDAVESGKFI